jgi:N-acetylglucosaminyldiphosphoundecaprenol N-acetyl-beta-D-mannosaminyltransferase
MWRFCARAERLGLRIFLYGGKRETLERLERQLRAAFPSLRIAGAYAPPFRVLTPAEQHAINAHINKSGAHAVFVSLGCPKQERGDVRCRCGVRVSRG